MEGPFIALTGFGARTPVGNDAAQAASTERAGCARFRPCPHLGIFFDHDSLVAPSLELDLDDLPWTERVTDLLPEPVHEALWSAKLYDPSEARGRNRVSKLAAYAATPFRERAKVLSLDHAGGLAAVARHRPIRSSDPSTSRSSKRSILFFTGTT